MTAIQDLYKHKYVLTPCNGKRPIIKNWTKTTLDDCLEKLVGHEGNIGIVTGKVSGIIVVDIDNKDHGLSAWNSLIGVHGDPDTIKVKTGGGGYHYYFEYEPGFTSRSKHNGVGIDVKTDGGFVVCPPSKHEKGVYEWINPPGHNLAKLPEWLKEWLSSKKNLNNENKEAQKDKENKEREKREKREKKEKKEKKDKKETEEKEDDQFERCDYSHNEEHVERVLCLLSIERADNYDDWIKVGMGLCSSQPPDKNYFKVWEKWSKQSQKYKPQECLEKWKTFREYQGNPVTLGSIHRMAKNDSPLLYEELKRDECIRDCIRECEGFPQQIDRIIQRDDRFIATDRNTFCRLSGTDHGSPNNYWELERFKRQVSYACRSYECLDRIAHVGEIPTKIYNNLFKIDIHNHYHGSEEPVGLFEGDNYSIFEETELNSLCLQALRGADYDISILIYHLWNKSYKWHKIDKAWYTFRDHRWSKLEYGMAELITENTVGYMQKIKEYYKKHDRDERKMGQIQNLIKYLRKKVNVKHIEEACRDTWAIKDRESFHEKLDIKPHLIGFNNGVYDLDRGLFRDGNIEDYLSLSVGYDYPTNGYSLNREGLISFLEQIQPDNDQRGYMLRFLASTLYGRNREEVFHIFSGTGRNGKSKLIELVNITFGDYGSSIAATVLTKEQPSSSVPRPEIIDIRYSRFVSASEPENNQKLNANFIKSLSGNDRLSARNLFESSMVKFVPQFSLVLLCNSVPEFDVDDEAIWDRCRCVEFPSKFVSNPIHPNEILIDYALKDKLELWRNDFLLLLLENYNLYKSIGLFPTENVLKFTQKTKEDNDLYKQFLDEKTVEAPGENIHMSTLWNYFEDWYKINGDRNKKPKRAHFSRGIEKYYQIIKVREDPNDRNSAKKGIKDVKLL